MSDNFFNIPLEPLILTRKKFRLWVKFYWYKWILRKDIIGFFGGIPIIRDNNLEENCNE